MVFIYSFLKFICRDFILLFLMCLFIISFVIICYGLFYLSVDFYYSVYFVFLVLFLVSMVGFVSSCSFLLLLVFWDLLGVSSFVLVIYY